jgi:glycosyltransferase involved in cell wall biosynthesis
VVYESYRAWVIAGMLRDSLSSINKEAAWYYFPDSRKFLARRIQVKSRCWKNTHSLLVFGNHKTYLELYKGKKIAKSKVRVFVTQILEDDKSLEIASEQTLNLVERYIVQNGHVASYLRELGIPQRKIVVNPGGIDREIFYPLSDLNSVGDYILVSGSFKYRKNPDLIAKVIQGCPDMKFKIHGENFGVFPSELGTNVEFIKFNFQNQPKLIREARLHLVLSSVEGGPMSVLEALASGTPCVTTNVGFCEEILSQNSGIVLSARPTIEEIKQAIVRAWHLKTKVYSKDLLNGDYNWEKFGKDLFL